MRTHRSNATPSRSFKPRLWLAGFIALALGCEDPNPAQALNDAARPDADAMDAAPRDGAPDAREPDAADPDAGSHDATRQDAAPDAAPIDAAPIDAAPDADTTDAAHPDTGPLDASPMDAAPLDAAPDACLTACDQDGDGLSLEAGDCDDTDPLVFPGAPELCNAIDDDCDGQADDLVEACYEGPPNTLGLGVCRPGRRQCTEGAFGRCVGQIVPALAEACNQQDDDCDGLVDEGCDEDGDGVGPAQGDCDDHNPDISPDAQERCNGQDDNCDGQIDEADGDCYPGPAETEGRGRCRPGVLACAEGGERLCLNAVLPIAERCGDGADDDCDGEADEGCEDVICPPVHRDSPVHLSVSCTTTGSAAQPTVVVELLDELGVPMDGEVVITASPALELVDAWDEGPLHARTFAPPETPGELRFTVSVPCDEGRELALSTQPTLRVVHPPQPGRDVVTGGCALEGELDVTVLDEGGEPLPDAWVMVGTSPAFTLQPDPLAAALEIPGEAPNFTQVDPWGRAHLTDLGPTLRGPVTVTVSAPGHENVTLIGTSASALLVPLRATARVAATAQIQGRLTQFDSLAVDGLADAGLVLGSFDLAFLTRLALPKLLSRSECYDPMTRGNFAGMVNAISIPGNVYLPGQNESIFAVPIFLDEHPFSLTNVPLGADTLIGLSGKISLNAMVPLLMGGTGGLADLIGALELKELGVTPIDLQGDVANLAIPQAIPLQTNAQCVAEELPPGASLLCVAAGDWSGADGTGRLFPMGLASIDAQTIYDQGESAASAPLTTAHAEGVLRGIGYVGAAIALFADSREPEIEGALSAVLDRVNLASGGGTIEAAGFFLPPRLSHEGMTFSWTAVSAELAPQVCQVELVHQIRETYSPGTCSGPATATQDLPAWRALVAGDAQQLALPVRLPDGWPNAATGGLPDLASTPEDDRLIYRLTCFGLSADFSFDDADFYALTEDLARLTTNAQAL